jgi:hypothetical protein
VHLVGPVLHPKIDIKALRLLHRSTLNAIVDS